MRVGVADFIDLLDLQASIFVGDNVKYPHFLGGHTTIRALQRASGL